MQMTIAWSSTLAFLLSLCAAGPPGDQPVQKPIKERTVHSAGGLGAPLSLPELYAMSPLVIDATVQGERPVDQVLESALPGHDTVIVMTAHSLVVNEVFKDAVPGGIQGRRIEITQLGGARDRGEYIESVVDERFPPLKRGERYIFFLRPSSTADEAYLVSTGSPDGVLSLDVDGTVKSRGSSRLARDLERYTHFDLTNALRDLRERRQ